MRFSTMQMTGTDPARNLAAEQYVFDCLPRDRSYVLLWQNDRAVIISKYQNAAAEINAGYVRRHGIRVVRRLSGGGAVYHDLGNLNFTIITDADAREKIDLALFCEPVVRALARFGVKAEISGRNDITVDGKKFSGNAQYRREGRVMHHGTILFDSDLAVVQKALKPDAEKLESKGVASVRSRVTNLAPYLPEGTTLADFRTVLLEEMTAGGDAEPFVFSEEDEAAIGRLVEERYGTWEWNRGASPPATLKKSRRIPGCGRVEVRMRLKGGRIAGLSFRGDFFSDADPAQLAEKLTGLAPEREALEAALADTDAAAYIAGLTNRALIGLITE